MANRGVELIRLAQPDDIVSIARMLQRFYRTHGHVYGIPYDHGSCLQTVLDCVARGVCLIGNGSTAGALLLPFPYNRSYQVAHVVFWYLENKREASIFDRLISECRKAGATHINASTLAPKNTGKRFYAARGMALAEFQFIGPILKKPCTDTEKA